MNVPVKPGIVLKELFVAGMAFCVGGKNEFDTVKRLF